MEQIEKQGLPILQRLDRLERLVQFVEEKKNLLGTGSQSPSSTVEKSEWKTLSSALEEVHYKGTLLERLQIIEKRVLQLSMEMEMVNKLTSSYSSFVQSERSLSKSDDDSVKADGIEINCEKMSQVSAKAKIPNRRAPSPKKWLRLLSVRACGK